jgi:hypothetical protein
MCCYFESTRPVIYVQLKYKVISPPPRLSVPPRPAEDVFQSLSDISVLLLHDNIVEVYFPQTFPGPFFVRLLCQIITYGHTLLFDETMN